MHIHAQEAGRLGRVNGYDRHGLGLDGLDGLHGFPGAIQPLGALDVVRAAGEALPLQRQDVLVHPQHLSGMALT